MKSFYRFINDNRREVSTPSNPFRVNCTGSTVLITHCPGLEFNPGAPRNDWSVVTPPLGVGESHVIGRVPRYHFFFCNSLRT